MSTRDGLAALAAAALCVLATAEAAAAQTFQSTLVRTIDTGSFSKPSPDPSGLAYIAATNRLIVVDGEVEETVGGITHFEGANWWETTLAGQDLRDANISKREPTQLPMTDEPTGVAFNPTTGQYYVTEDGGKRVYRVTPGADDLVGTSDDTFTFFRTLDFGNSDPEGITYDSLRDELVVADGTNSEIWRYTPAGNPVSHFDVLAHGVDDPESVEFNPSTGTLFVLSNRQSGPVIIEVTVAGQLLQTIAVPAYGAHRPAGLAYAPASDGSGAQRFYIADRGIDNDSNPQIIDGKIVEITAPGAPPVNRSPVITSDGGGESASRTVPEGQTAAADVDATDPDGDGMTFSLVGGADASAFTIDQATGVLRFGAAPDFEAPGDSGQDNVYDVVVAVGDGRGGSDSQAIAITVSDVGDEGRPLHLGWYAEATVGGVDAANEDLLRFDGSSAFSFTFDGSDVGLARLRSDAVAWLDADTLLLSFDTDRAVPGIPGTVADADVVRFDATSLGAVTAGSFSMYFDGSDVALTETSHDVDALELLPDGRLLLSLTGGSVTLPGLTVRDEDVMAFSPTSWGEATAGTFSLYFDGSDVGLGQSGEDVSGLAVDAAGRLYLSAQAGFAVPGLSGADEDAFEFVPTSLGAVTAGSYSPTLVFDGSAFGLSSNRLSALAIPFG